MKKLAMILCLLMTVCIAPTSVLAGGAECTDEFSVNGFNYCFEYGTFDDEYGVDENSTLWITGYNGSRLLDINNTPVMPQGLYVYEIMQAAELYTDDQYYNFEAHKNEYIPVWRNPEWYYYNPNETVNVLAANNGAEATAISFSDQKPIIVNDRTLLPIRAIAEYYNWNVTYDEERNMVMVENDTKQLKIEINSGYFTVIQKDSVIPDTSSVKLDVPAMALNDRTLLPIRAVAEALELQVEWLPTENAVFFTNE